jgi:hypothetical protein
MGIEPTLNHPPLAGREPWKRAHDIVMNHLSAIAYHIKQDEREEEGKGMKDPHRQQ